jgi:flagellar basal body-associated protein FliL
MTLPISDIPLDADLSRTTAGVRNWQRISISSAVYGLIIACTVCSGVIFFLTHTGRIVVGPRTRQQKNQIANIPKHLLVFDPILVNLADKDASTYLRLSMVVQVSSVAIKNLPQVDSGKNGNPFMVALRDTALAVLGRETSGDLLAQGGKDRLKMKLITAFRERDRTIDINQIFFTEFLVQR